MHLWGWGTWRKKWRKIRPAYMEYFKFIKNIDYRGRPSKVILKFYKFRGFTIKASSQDAAFYYAMNKNNFISLNTYLQRAKYIGAYGEHMRPEKYIQRGYQETEPLNSNDEAYLKKFEGYDANTFLAQNNSIFRFKVNVFVRFLQWFILTDSSKNKSTTN